MSIKLKLLVSNYSTHKTIMSTNETTSLVADNEWYFNSDDESVELESREESNKIYLENILAEQKGQTKELLKLGNELDDMVKDIYRDWRFENKPSRIAVMETTKHYVKFEIFFLRDGKPCEIKEIRRRKKKGSFGEAEKHFVNKWFDGSDAEFCYNTLGYEKPIVVKDIDSDGSIIVSNGNATATFHKD